MSNQVETPRVRDLMVTKPLFEVGEDDGLAVAAHRMAWLGCRHLPVTREHEVVGVVADHDLLTWRADGRSLDGPDDRVRMVMSAPPIVATPDETLAEASARMIASRIDCLPVVEHGRLVGILTSTDLLGAQVSRPFENEGNGANASGGRRSSDANRLMTVFEAIARRRAVRAYKPGAIEEATVRELLAEAVRAPTAMHAEPWTFAVVQDRPLLKKLSDLTKETWSPDQHGSAKVGHAPSASESRAGAILSQPDFNIFYNAGTLVVICSRSSGNFAVADCWLAAENLMLAACGMGLGTCCIGFAIPMLNRPDVKAELGIPADVTAIAPIIVGVPSAEPASTTRKSPEILCWRR